MVSSIFNFHTPTWGNDPIWLYDIFEMGWNHQLDNVDLLQIDGKTFQETAHSLDPDASSCNSNLSPVRMIQSPKVSPFAIALQPLAMISR